MNITTTNSSGHGFAEGDVVEFSTMDRRLWKRLWHFVTFRRPPVQRRRYTVSAVTTTTLNIKERPMPRPNESHRVDVYSVDNETDAAVLVTVKGGPHDYAQMWFPLSQVSEIHRHDAEPYIVASLWIAKKKGLVT